MARPIFGGKKIDAPVFLSSLAVGPHFENRRVAKSKSLSLLVKDRYYYTIVVFFGIGCFGPLMKPSAGSLPVFSSSSKNATLAKTKNWTLFLQNRDPKVGRCGLK